MTSDRKDRKIDFRVEIGYHYGRALALPFLRNEGRKMYGNYDVIVKRKSVIGATPVIIAMLAIIALITFLLFKFAGAVAFMPLPVFLTAAFFLGRYFKMILNVEFEYSYLDGTFSITKILNQQKRLPTAQVEINSISEFGLFTRENRDQVLKKAEKIFKCDTGEDDDTHYYFIVKGEDGGGRMFTFTPDEKLLGILASRNQMIASVRRKSV